MLTACSAEQESSNQRTDNVVVSKEVLKLPENHLLGCWKEKEDSLETYWCFDSAQVNRSGYIHPYLFHGDTVQISTIQYRFQIEESNLLLLNLLDSTEISLSKSNLTESPDVF